MFVIAVCALCSGAVLKLNWWPMVRDCIFYSISIFVMLIIICNDVISWPEALFMLLLYVVYCIALHFNSALERWAYSLNLPIKLPTKEEQSSLVTFKNIPEQSYTQDQKLAETKSPELDKPAEPAYDQYADPNSSWDPNDAWGSGAAQPVAPVAAVQSNNSWGDGWDNSGYNAAGDYYDQQQQPPQQQEQIEGQTQSGQPVQKVETKVGAVVDDYYRPREPRASESHNPLEKPANGSQLEIIAWAIVYPIHYLCRKTMPDVKTEKYRHLYPLTFMISMIWISFYSYIMVWMIVIIGTTLGIPDTVMGLTFVAAGVSVPDALSSIAVIKVGHHVTRDQRDSKSTPRLVAPTLTVDFQSLLLLLNKIFLLLPSALIKQTSSLLLPPRRRCCLFSH